MPAGGLGIPSAYPSPMLPPTEDPVPDSVQNLRAVVFRDRGEMAPRMVAALRQRGASELLAEEVVEQILADCMRGDGHNLLARFHGNSPLDAWLMRVAANRMVSAWRRTAVRHQEPPQRALEAQPVEDSAMRELVSQALRGALASLEPQDRVLLWLRHGFGVPQKRLCVSWRCSAAEMSRMLSRAREFVRRRTLAAVSRVEPGLNLGWEDICAACGDDEL